MTCSNDNKWSPYVLTLPASTRSGDRWWADGACSGGTCTNLWTVFDLGSPHVVSTMRFINYHDPFSIKAFSLSTSTSLSGPWAVEAHETGFPTEGSGNLGTTQNQYTTVPDMLFTFDPPLSGRYIKLTVLENNGGSGSGFFRAEFNGGQQTASATGDPHLQNIRGDRFDLMAPGSHVLINIPRGERAESALLRVQADARRLGGHCADMYFQTVNITGAWAEKAQVGGLHFDVSSPARDQSPRWVILGPVELRVTLGHTGGGTKYMNVFVRHLDRAGFAVGGLLGEDDHEAVSTPPTECVQHLSLGKERPLGRDSSASSIAAGTLA